MQAIKKQNAALLGEELRLSELNLPKKTVDPTETIRTAIEGFEDGLVRILKNEEEMNDLNSMVDVQEGDVFSFIRLTFLAGRMW